LADAILPPMSEVRAHEIGMAPRRKAEDVVTERRRSP